MKINLWKKLAILTLILCAPVWAANDELKDCGDDVTAQIPADLIELAKLIVEKESQASDPALADVTASLRDTIATKRSEAKTAHSMDDATLDDRLAVLVEQLQSGATLEAPAKKKPAKRGKAATAGTVSDAELKMVEASIQWALVKKLAMGPALIRAVHDKELDIVKGFTILFHKRDAIEKASPGWKRYCANWDPSRPDPEGKCSLHHAVDKEAEEIGLALVEVGVLIELTYAVQYENSSIAMALIAKGQRAGIKDVVGKQPSDEVPLKLIELGVELDADDLEQAIVEGRLEVVKKIHEKRPDLLNTKPKSGMAALEMAINQKQVEIQDFCFDEGSEFGEGELIEAFLHGQQGIARKMLERKPELVNASFEINLENNGKETQTALVIAVDRKDGAMIDLAVEFNVDLEAIPDGTLYGENALSRSIRVGEKESFDKLMGAGVDPSGRLGEDGITPVETAIVDLRLEWLSDLIVAGADLEAKPSEKYHKECDGYLKLAEKVGEKLTTDKASFQSTFDYHTKELRNATDDWAKNYHRENRDNATKSMADIDKKSGLLTELQTILKENWSK